MKPKKIQGVNVFYLLHPPHIIQKLKVVILNFKNDRLFLLILKLFTKIAIPPSVSYPHLLILLHEVFPD